MDKALLDIINNFDSLGSDFVIGNRNKIKIIPFKNLKLNIKSFKVPTLINAIIYRFFRKSKAERSFIHAKILEEKGIGTPKPIAFYDKKSTFRLLDSYYICEHMQPDYVLKELFLKNFDQIEEELKQFAKFTFQLHENGIEFLDHSPGNTLLKKNEMGYYNFYLVDLNRMNFHKEMSFDKRMKNFARITPSEIMVKTFSSEYAKLYGKREEEVFKLMWKYNSDFQRKVIFKRNIKKNLGIK